MRQIGSGAPEGAWNREIVGQLGFIKMHLRYPMGRRTVWPIAPFAAALPAAAFIIYTLAFGKSNNPDRAVWPVWIVIAIMMLPAVVAAGRYLRTLRFVAVPARRTTAENMLLIRQFLLAHRFAVGRHPEAPEVFQMISKSIGALKDEREVVIFIADEGRILVNSHFTQNRFKAAVGAPHYRQIAKMLADWIKRTEQPSTDLGFPAF